MALGNYSGEMVLYASPGRDRPWRRRWSLLLGCVLLLAAAGVGAAEPVYRDVSVAVAADQAPPADSAHVRVFNWTADTRELRATVDATGLAELAAAGYVVHELPAVRAGGYLTEAQVAQKLADWEAQYPSLCQVSSIGLSGTDGRSIWGLRIAGQTRSTGVRPQFHVNGGIHGDEPVGTDIAMRFARHLLEGYGSDSTIATLVNRTEFFILPLLNPDGYVRNWRANAAGVDLNRDFPSATQSQTSVTGRQAETAAIMTWTSARRLTAALTLHGGALGVAYPWGHDHQYWNPDQQNPETALYQSLALGYTVHNPAMWANNSGNWFHGTINGCQWYPTVGGELQDWSYRGRGCLQMTVELSATKAPTYPGFDAGWSLWDANREGLLALARQAHGGVRGTVTALDGSPVAARIGLGRRPDDGSGTAHDGVAFLHLLPGWNLVALPLTPVPADPELLFPSGVGPCWAWERGTYHTVSECQAGVGMWLYNPGPGRTVTVTGTVTPEALTPLDTGWNLVGAAAAGRYVPAGSLRFGYGYDGASKHYTSLASGTILEPQAGYWLWADAGMAADLREPANRPSPVFADPASGEFCRLLEPGSYEVWFDDARPATLQYSAPLTSIAGSPLTASVALQRPWRPLQTFGVTVAAGVDADNLPAHTELAPVLAAAAGDVLRCRWSANKGSTWQQTDTALAAEAAVGVVTLQTNAGQDDLRFCFELWRGSLKLAAAGSLQNPYQVTLLPAGRSAVTRVAPATNCFLQIELQLIW